MQQALQILQGCMGHLPVSFMLRIRRKYATAVVSAPALARLDCNLFISASLGSCSVVSNHTSTNLSLSVEVPSVPYVHDTEKKISEICILLILLTGLTYHMKLCSPYRWLVEHAIPCASRVS